MERWLKRKSKEALSSEGEPAPKQTPEVRSITAASTVCNDASHSNQ